MQSLSSMAIGPVLMMNWRSVVAYFPAVEKFIDGFDVDVVIRFVLGTRLGLSGLGLVGTLLLLHIAWTAWTAIRKLVLVWFYTKCSVPEACSLHDQILEWIVKNPRFHSVSTGQIVVSYK